ncbi:hypothetical protein PtB15_1B987 [Puccinia triticina]|nr:hypothetical protein PtB15_1B987 [Puccinia triticina]
MIKPSSISKWVNLNRSGFLLRSTNHQFFSTSKNPTQAPSRHSKETSEQAAGGTTDDIAHSKGAFDSNEANPEKSASKISANTSAHPILESIPSKWLFLMRETSSFHLAPITHLKISLQTTNSRVALNALDSNAPSSVLQQTYPIHFQ